jgi:hypothetical protein
MPDSSEDFATITVPYLLVLHIPYSVDAGGRVLLERAWHHDLVQQSGYGADLMSVCGSSRETALASA